MPGNRDAPILMCQTLAHLRPGVLQTVLRVGMTAAVEDDETRYGERVRIGLLMVLLLAVGCKKSDPTPTPPAASSVAAQALSPAMPAPAGSPPPDGKYERVVVEGVTVPMIQVMDHGATLLVDTDGKKPRTWEEQYKRKRPSLLVGQYDLHKTDTNKNDKFDDDPIDKEGLWVIDEKGNVSKH